MLRSIALATLVAALGAGLLPGATTASGTTYYVDCSGGSDSDGGTTVATAWRSIGRANNASLTPGSSLLFKRGCTWSGTSLQARWNGTAAQPITIGAYGQGNAPLIQNAQDQVYVRGSWLVIEDLAARADAVTTDPQCQNGRAGRRTGFRLVAGASHNLLRGLTASDLFFGIKLDTGSHHNRVIGNIARDNDMKSDDWSSDAGMVGIGILGDDNEVAHNTISGSDGCSRFHGRDGSAVEVYGGQRNRIHHNRAIDNNQFVELGNSRSADNVIAYNVVTSRLEEGHFLTTRGARDTRYGPVLRTRVSNNTAYLTGRHSFAVICAHGCGPSVLSLHNNVIWAADRVGYADAAFDEGHNVFWSLGGDTIWFPMSATSRRADPAWVSPGSGDFRLTTTSPAVDRGGNMALQLGYSVDFAGTPVPQGIGVDVGALERPAAAPPDARVVRDTFSRTLPQGWGTADIGGRYTTQGRPERSGVSNGTGWMRVSRGTSHMATLFGVSARDVDATTRLSVGPGTSGHGTWVYFVSRRGLIGSEYRTKLRIDAGGRIFVGISKTVAGIESPLVAERAAGIQHRPGSYLLVRTKTTGADPTMLRIKVWQAGTKEPGSWTLTALDTTPSLQDGGAVALQAYGANDGDGRAVTIRFDKWVVTRL